MRVWERVQAWLTGSGLRGRVDRPGQPGRAGQPGHRVQGEPPSGNGASSFHLFWDLPGEFIAVTADLEILRTPTEPRLCFWALQADFIHAGRPSGGGHLGLQYHPSYPGGTAVNWGGYNASGTELSGSTSSLRSSLSNPNTRDFSWEVGRRYRLSIAPAAESEAGAGGMPADRGLVAWRGAIADVDRGQTVVVRDLWAAGSRLTRPMVWSEIFARCEHPSVDVRWSWFEAVAADGTRHRPDAVAVNYQSWPDGGCSNTNSWRDAGGIRQMTNTERITPQGSRLRLGGPDASTSRS